MSHHDAIALAEVCPSTCVTNLYHDTAPIWYRNTLGDGSIRVRLVVELKLIPFRSHLALMRVARQTEWILHEIIFFRATNFLTKNAPIFSPKFLSLCSVGQKKSRKTPSKFPTKFSKFPAKNKKFTDELLQERILPRETAYTFTCPWISFLGVIRKCFWTKFWGVKEIRLSPLLSSQNPPPPFRRVHLHFLSITIGNSRITFHLFIFRDFFLVIISSWFTSKISGRIISRHLSDLHLLPHLLRLTQSLHQKILGGLFLPRKDFMCITSKYSRGINIVRPSVSNGKLRIAFKQFTYTSN